MDLKIYFRKFHVISDVNATAFFKSHEIHDMNKGRDPRTAPGPKKFSKFRTASEPQNLWKTRTAPHQNQ